MILNSNFNYRETATAATILRTQPRQAEIAPSEPQVQDTVAPLDGGYMPLSGTSMATPVAFGAIGLLMQDNPEYQARQDQQTAQDIRDLAKEEKISLTDAVETYLFADAESFEIGMSEAEVKEQRGERRQEMMDLLALNQPETQRAVSGGPIALLD